jgi:hypothetical protein
MRTEEWSPDSSNAPHLSVASGHARAHDHTVRHLRWAFVNGESHTELEDAILDKIDKQRAVERVHGPVTLLGECAHCNKRRVPVSRVSGELWCNDCRRARWAPMSNGNGNGSTGEDVTPPVQKRGGPYYVQVPGEPKRIVDARSVREASSITARRLERRRVPKGTRIWQA